MKILSRSLILLTFLASSTVFAEAKTLKLSNMTCQACVKSVQKTLCEGFKASLTKCEVKVGEATIEGQKLDMNAISAALTAGGYPIDNGTAAPKDSEAKTCSKCGKKVPHKKGDKDCGCGGHS